MDQKQQKLLIIILHKFSLFTALTLKLNGLIVARKCLEARRNVPSGTYIFARKKQFQVQIRKRKTRIFVACLRFNELYLLEDS